MSNTTIPPWKRIDNFSPRRHQELVDGLNRVLHLTVPGAAVLDTATGRTIQLPQATPPKPIGYPGKIVAAGPNGGSTAADFTDNRYWVKLQELAPPATGSGSTDDPAAGPYPQDTALIAPVLADLAVPMYGSTPTASMQIIVPVTNIAEQAAASHFLPTGASLPVWVWQTTDSGRIVRWWMNTPRRDGLIPVTLTSDGGSDGNKTTAATWTYTAVGTVDSVAYGTGLSPTKPRPKGTMTAATDGIGYVNAAGTFVLMEAYETEGSGGCP